MKTLCRSEWYFNVYRWCASSVNLFKSITWPVCLEQPLSLILFPTSQSMHIVIHVRHQNHKITRKAYVVEIYFLIPIDSTFRPRSHPQRQITARCKCHVNLLVNTPGGMVLKLMSLLSLLQCLQQITLIHIVKPQQFYDRICASIKLIPCCSTKNISPSGSSPASSNFAPKAIPWNLGWISSYLYVHNSNLPSGPEITNQNELRHESRLVTCTLRSTWAPQ